MHSAEPIAPCFHSSSMFSHSGAANRVKIKSVASSMETVPSKSQNTCTQSFLTIKTAKIEQQGAIPSEERYHRCLLAAKIKHACAEPEPRPALTENGCYVIYTLWRSSFDPLDVVQFTFDEIKAAPNTGWAPRGGRARVGRRAARP